MTSAQGTVTSCGPGQYFSLQFTCAGPSCVDLNGFPNTTCTTDGTTFTCTNGVVCPGPTNYTSDFSFTQSNIIVSQTQRITLPDFCEEIDLTSDGTTGGSNATMVTTGTCGPGSSNSSTSTTSSSTSTTSPSTSSTVAPSSGFLPSTASQNGTYTLPKLSSTTATATANLNSTLETFGTTSTSAKTFQAVSWSPGASHTSSGDAGELAAATGGSWAPWPASSISESSSAPQGSGSTKWTTAIPASADGLGTKATETIHTSTWPAFQFPGPTDLVQSSQAGYHSSEASPVAGSSKLTSDGPIYTGNSQWGHTGGTSSVASIQEAWSGQSSGPATPELTNPSPTGTPTTSSGGYAITLDSPTGSGSSPPIATFTNNAGSFRHHNAPALWCVLLLFFGFVVQGTHASAYASYVGTAELTPVERDVPENSALVSYAQHDLAERDLTPGWKEFSDIFSEYLAGKLTSPGFADNLVEELAKAICDHAAGKLITAALGVDLVDACVTAIYTGNALVAPELEFLSVFGASVLCNLMVSEALPGIEALTNLICDVPKPCSDDLLTDPNNCGSCGNVCPTGVCANGACTSNSCTGQTCSTFGPCGPGGTCVCASTTELTGYCVDGSTPCAGLADCVSSANCASGEICASQSCCGRNVCVGATFCGGGTATSTTSSAAKLLRRTWENATIGSMGTWANTVRL